MILRSLRFSSLGDSFAGQTVTMDFTALPPGVYALVGGNGAGKTTALEAMLPGLLYRQFPSYRETVQQKATSRTAFLEGEFEAGGQLHKIVIQSDPQAGGAGRGKTEAYWYLNVVTDPYRSWVPMAGPLLADFDRYREQWFPSLDLLLAGPMCAQKVVRGNGSFFSASPAERKELFVEALGLGRLEEQSKGYRLRRQEIETRIGGIDMMLQPPTIGVTLVQVRAAVDRTARDTAQAQETLEAAEYALTTKEAAFVELKRAHEEYGKQVKWFDERDQARAQEWAAITAERAAIEDDRARLDVLRQRKQEAPTDTALLAARRTLETLMVNLKAAGAVFDEKQAGFQQSIRHRDTLAARQKALAPMGAALAGVDLSLELCQRCPLTQQAQPAAVELPMLKAELSVAQEEVSLRQTHSKKAATSLEANTTRHDAAKAELHALEQAAASIPADLDAQLQAWHARDAAWKEREAKHWRGPFEAKQGPEEPPPLDDVIREVKGASDAKSAARRALDAAQKAHTEAETHLQAAVEAEARARDLRASRGKLVADAAALKLLEDGLGKSGLQAVYCDQAGPPIESLTNHLLHQTFGPRFSIGFDTRRLKKGKKASDPDAYQEVFDLRILDGWNNAERAQGSGGQTVWFDTALRLALSIYVTQQTGKDLRTLCFDEPSGQLDDQLAPKFTDMLKAARRLGGFHHVFLVSHQREVWGACDGFYVFKGGRVTYAGDIEAADALLEG